MNAINEREDRDGNVTPRSIPRTVRSSTQVGARGIRDDGLLREDGRMVHSMFLFEVKKPEESKGPWDYYKVLAEVPGDQAFRQLNEGGCPLL
jgi:hypothetical protein